MLPNVTPMAYVLCVYNQLSCGCWVVGSTHEQFRITEFARVAERSKYREGQKNPNRKLACIIIWEQILML